MPTIEQPSSQSPEKEPIPQEETNPYILSQERKVFRHITNSKNSSKIEKNFAEEELTKINEQLKGFKIEAAGGLAAAKEQLRRAKLEAEEELTKLDLEAITKSFGNEAKFFQNISNLAKEISELTTAEIIHRLASKNNPIAHNAHEKLFTFAIKEKERAQQEQAKYTQQYPILTHANELVKEATSLRQEGHIASTPTVEEYLTAIGQSLILGKPMFLHGPTGTGKTSLARLAAFRFTGKPSEMVYCNPQTRESSIWGKTGIRPTGKEGAIETVDIYGPLAKAMRDGKVVIFDEFTALPQEQMVFIKGIFNAKPGDEVNIVGNQKTKIQPDFQMIFTANLKSEKNPERQELPPEVAREFEQNNLEILYTPKEEAYDIILARLLSNDGSINLSFHDLNTTLPKLCEAMAEIQLAYTGIVPQESAKELGIAEGAKQFSLKKLVLTQGTIENIIDAWKIEQTKQEPLSFIEFLNSRLKTTLTFKEYPLTDRILAAKILASKGLITTLSEEDLSLPPKTLDFAVSRDERQPEAQEAMIKKSKKIQQLTLKEAATLDPWKIRRETAKTTAESFVKPETKPSTTELTEVQKQKQEKFLRDSFKMWYDQKTADTAQVIGIPSNPVSEDYADRSKDNQSKLGEYTYNPETQNVDFEVLVDKLKVLELAQFRGQPIHQVLEHLKSLSNTYYLPGLEFEQWLIEELPKLDPSIQDKFKDLKDGNWHLFPGSLLRRSNGRWGVLRSRWDGAMWVRFAYWLGSDWNSSYRVVLFKR